MFLFKKNDKMKRKKLRKILRTHSPDTISNGFPAPNATAALLFIRLIPLTEKIYSRLLLCTAILGQKTASCPSQNIKINGETPYNDQTQYLVIPNTCRLAYRS
jgi:hypothetical protein